MSPKPNADHDTEAEDEPVSGNALHVVDGEGRGGQRDHLDVLELASLRRARPVLQLHRDDLIDLHRLILCFC